MFKPSITDNNKDKIAIVVVGYNRIKSMRRLLASLSNAHYDHSDIPLVISIDCSGDEELYDYVKSFEWKHGIKYVNIQEKRLGLKNHILQCGDLTKYFKAVIILEDDIFVSEYYYQFVEKAVDFYNNEDRIGGIALLKNEIIDQLPQYYINDGSDTFLRMRAESWGECWTELQWKNFRKWYSEFQDDRFRDLDIPEKMKSWKKAWSKYFHAYLVETGRYFVIPQTSLTTCFVDAGEHSSLSSNIGQVEMLMSAKDFCFKSFDEMVRYDVYDNNEAIYDWLGLSREDLCIDFRCDKINIRKCRYILTPALMKHRIVKSFGLSMRPIELNIKYNIEGKGLFLYDTITGDDCASRVGLPETISNYYLRGYAPRQAANYSLQFYKRRLKHKLGLDK